MYCDLESGLAKFSRMSSEETAIFFSNMSGQSCNDLVKIKWNVTYDPMGQDMHSIADVFLVHADDALLQIFLKNTATGNWIPETQPWEISAVEFQPEQRIASAKLGLIDSKWTSDDIGLKYRYQLWGYLLHGEKVESFAFEKSATYPGDA